MSLSQLGTMGTMLPAVTVTCLTSDRQADGTTGRRLSGSHCAPFYCFWAATVESWLAVHQAGDCGVCSVSFTDIHDNVNKQAVYLLSDDTLWYIFIESEKN